MQLKKPGGMGEEIETRVVTYPDLQAPEFASVNPLKKVPALIRSDGVTVFESNVIVLKRKRAVIRGAKNGGRTRGRKDRKEVLQ